MDKSLTKHLPYIHAERRWIPLRADTITKDYVKDAGVFADIFNYYIYGGRQVILPEQLMERDSTKIAWFPKSGRLRAAGRNSAAGRACEK